PRSFTVVLVGEKSLEMLVDEKEAEKLRVADRDEDEPRCGNGQKQCGATDRVQAPPERPVAREDTVGDQRSPWQHDADEALRQNGQRERGPAEKHPSALPA